MFLRHFRGRHASARPFSIFHSPIIEAQVEEDAVKLRLPFKDQTLKVELDTSTHTLGHLRDMLVEKHQEIQTVTFRNLNGALMPSIERIRHLRSYPFTALINNKFHYTIEMTPHTFDELSVWNQDLA